MNIIELAKQAGIPIETDWAGRPSTLVIKDGGTYLRGVDDLTRFATLVRAAALEEAAGVCEHTLAQHYMKQAIPTHDEALLLAACADCAATIRQLMSDTDGKETK